ncbi:hypothetical protein HHL16_08390 [Pseudoflavitalea sp. G-6-1-2]|uniref:hypothetical protein n=1 Tax=Pseudoflavitalea sp. G-6-1-2 TaxID=2728841 RepID=UPI00146EDF0A|nr:hypothetical protein [Pseudoflavitalea sp. G-6-1-2]NML20889.1 hypothetical protein [Pseudoflavitalea sp. G-6-1-2]
MEIRLTVDDDFMDRLKEESGIENSTQLVSEALSLLKFAVAEARKGRVLISADEDGENVKRIVIPSLEPSLQAKFNGSEN